MAGVQGILRKNKTIHESTRNDSNQGFFSCAFVLFVDRSLFLATARLAATADAGSLKNTAVC